MSRAPSFSSVDAVSEAELVAACGARGAGIALLTRAVEVSKPGQGRALLSIVGRVSTASFLGGVLEIRVQPDADWSMIDLFVDTGAEVTRLAPTLLSSVPFAELSKVAAAASPLELAGAVSPRRLRLRGPEPVADLSPESDVLAGALIFPDPPTRRKSVAPQKGKSVAPPRSKSVAPTKAKSAPPPRPAPRPVAESPPAAPAARRPAPSDVKATVRADAAPVPLPPKRSSSAPRAPRPDVKATIKVETVHIPKEAIGGKKAVAPPRELLRKVDRTSALIPRDDEE